MFEGVRRRTEFNRFFKFAKKKSLSLVYDGSLREAFICGDGILFYFRQFLFKLVFIESKNMPKDTEGYVFFRTIQFIK